MSADESTGPLAEFAALRAEIDALSRTKVQLFTLQLTVTGAVFSFAISNPSLGGLLLIVPISSYLLCALYVSTEADALAIGSYIRAELSVKVPGGLGWEGWWREHSARVGRLNGWTLPLLILFGGSGVLALVWSASTFGAASSPIGSNVGLVSIWGIGVVASITCVFLVVSMGMKSFAEPVRSNGARGRESAASIQNSPQP